MMTVIMPSRVIMVMVRVMLVTALLMSMMMIVVPMIVVVEYIWMLGSAPLWNLGDLTESVWPGRTDSRCSLVTASALSLPAIADILGGQVEMHMASIQVAAPLAKAGQIKALAVTGAKRSSSLPEKRPPSLGRFRIASSAAW